MRANQGSSNADTSIVFAIDKLTGQAKHVREVPTGLACNCICPGCREPLEAVNAEAVRYKKRPHFRHPEKPQTSGCADRSLKEALCEAASWIESITLPAADPIVIALFPDAAASEADVVVIERFEVIDHTEALLHLPNGRTVRVGVMARSWGDGINPAGFDLSVMLPDDAADLQSIDDLVRYLTLDPDRWRWCARQTQPAPLAAEPPFELVGETANSLDELVKTPVDTAGEAVSDAPGSTNAAGKGVQEHAERQPVRSWTETVTFPGAGTMRFHRQIWPNGVMTEQREKG